jgi:hypothetical protein
MHKTLLMVAMVAACGGGPGASSGVTQSKAITELDAGEVSVFCEWAIEVQGGANHKTECGDGVSITVYDQAKCEAEYADVPAACSTVTVAEMEGCVNALGDNACGAFQSSACSEYLMCALGGQ